MGQFSSLEIEAQKEEIVLECSNCGCSGTWHGFTFADRKNPEILTAIPKKLAGRYATRGTPAVCNYCADSPNRR